MGGGQRKQVWGLGMEASQTGAHSLQLTRAPLNPCNNPVVVQKKPGGYPRNSTKCGRIRKMEPSSSPRVNGLLPFPHAWGRLHCLPDQIWSRWVDETERAHHTAACRDPSLAPPMQCRSSARLDSPKRAHHRAACRDPNQLDPDHVQPDQQEPVRAHTRLNGRYGARAHTIHK